MRGFEPYEPSGGDSLTDWAQKMHREAFTRRRILYTPGTLTSQTTQGVFHRLKPVEGGEIVSCEVGDAEQWPFRIKYRFPDSGDSSNVEIFDLINAEQYNFSTPSVFPRYEWHRSGVRLTRQIAKPSYISRITVTKDPIPDGATVVLGPDRAIDLTGLAGPFFYFGALVPGASANDDPLSRVAAAQTALDQFGLDENTGMVTEFEPLASIDDQPYYWAAKLRTHLVDDYLTAGLGGSKQLLRGFIPPGTVITVEGTVRL